MGCYDKRGKLSIHYLSKKTEDRLYHSNLGVAWINNGKKELIPFFQTWRWPRLLMSRLIDEGEKGTETIKGEAL